MAKMIQKPQEVVLKTFGTGQITLPKKWRDLYKVTYIRAQMHGPVIILTPLGDNPLGLPETDEDIHEPGYETVVDFTKHGWPNGIPAEKFIKILTKLNQQEGYEQNRKATRPDRVKTTRKNPRRSR